MSTFAVTRERLKTLLPIPKADRVELAQLEGMDFQFVVQKGVYAPGQEVLYIPLDSLVPTDLAERLGLTGKLGGPEKNRVRTVQLRGVYSQGVVAPIELAEGLTNPAQITQHLGICKWEPDPNITQDAILFPRPDGQGRYDIEAADRHPEIVELLLDVPVMVTEKLEGENFWVRGDHATGRIDVGMRDNIVQPKPGARLNRYLRAAEQGGFHKFVRHLVREYGQDVVVYGELVGPGGSVPDIYKHTIERVVVFDIRVGHVFLPPTSTLEWVNWADRNLGGFYHVPVLSQPHDTLRRWLTTFDPKTNALRMITVKEAADGMTHLCNLRVRREGIVIRPLEPQTILGFGRLILKQHSAAYLADSP